MKPSRLVDGKILLSFLEQRCLLEASQGWTLATWKGGVRRRALGIGQRSIECARARDSTGGACSEGARWQEPSSLSLARRRCPCPEALGLPVAREQHPCQNPDVPNSWELTSGCGGGASPQCPGGSQVRSMKWFWVNAKDGLGGMSGKRLISALGPHSPATKLWSSFSMSEIHALQRCGRDKFVSNYCKAYGYFSDQVDFWERVNGKSC